MKTVLITGSSRGIGAACAKRYAEEGYAVMIHYHTHKESAIALCKKLQEAGYTASVFGADISDPHQADALVKKTIESFGQLDVLVNNAGIALYKMFCDTTPDDWNQILSVNLMGMIYVTQAALPTFVHQKSGHIVNISSIWGLTGASCEVAYSTSKAAIIGLTKSLAKELGPSGILVNCVAPGVVDTDMNETLDPETKLALTEETPLLRIGESKDIADAVFFLGSEKNRFTTGQVLSPNGGILI